MLNYIVFGRVITVGVTYCVFIYQNNDIECYLGYIYICDSVCETSVRSS